MNYLYLGGGLGCPSALVFTYILWDLVIGLVHITVYATKFNNTTIS